MRMTHWLEKRAYLTPDRTALISGKMRMTFKQLRALSRSLANTLTVLGLQKDETVSFLCRNSLHVPVLVHAATYLGARLMPLNIRLAAREIAFQLRDSGCKLMLYDEFCSQLAQAVQQLVPELQVESVERIHQFQLDQPGDERLANGLQTEVDLNAVHTIMYTSGTTGHPKGVLLTYGNHYSSAIGSVLNLGLDADDVWLACVPLFHISGLSIIMRSVIYGMPIIIHEQFDPESVNLAIQREGVTVVSVVSNMLARMLDALGDETYPAHFRCMLLGGGPAPLPLLEACVNKGIPVYQTYGMTETASQIVTLPPEYMLSKLGSAGKPLFPCEIRIMQDGSEAPAGTAGEIFVRGPNVTSGYLNRPDADREAFYDGWFATGDIGYVDDEGFLYVLDRRKDLIVSGGENVYPAEIEAVLIGHPDIEEAGVAGVADARWGQVPAAYIKLKAGAVMSEQEVQAYCQDKLAKYKIPAHVYFVDALPRNASGKLLRRELTKLGK